MKNILIASLTLFAALPAHALVGGAVDPNTAASPWAAVGAVTVKQIGGNNMKLPSGLKIAKPRKLILAFVQHWYPMYDAVPVMEDNELRVADIALSTMLNSRISGNTGGAIFRQRETVQAALAGIPPNLDLLDIPIDGELPGASGISRAITSMCELMRVKLSVSTKILHKKRPGLIPIFDSVVAGQYYPRWCPNVRGQTWGDYALALIKLVQKDMHGAASELRDLRSELAERGAPMTPCRILNALTWIVRAGNEEWIVKQAKELASRKERK